MRRPFTIILAAVSYFLGKNGYPIFGFKSDGTPKEVLVDSDGKIQTSAMASDTLIGAVTETAPASDTASSGLNGRLQRIAQRLTSLIALLPASLGVKAPSASLSTVRAQSSAAPTNTAGTPFTILTADGTVFTLAAGETGFIQNHKDAVLNFKLGTGCSTTSLSGRLKACSAADDASGGFIKIENWIGVVSVAAATGSPRFSAWKI